MSTTLALPIKGLAGLFRERRSTARSDSARALDRMHEVIRVHLLESYAVSDAAERALKELRDIRGEASREGWDGYGAQPLSPASYAFAKAFLSALPTTAPVPEIGADSNGEIALDWVFGERKALTVRIGPSGRCTYAWMLGHSTSRGTDWVENEIPATIAFALRLLVQDSQESQVG
jgi:hypothetical protein